MKEYIKPNIEVLYLALEDNLLTLASKTPGEVEFHDYEGGAAGYDPDVDQL